MDGGASGSSEQGKESRSRKGAAETLKQALGEQRSRRRE